MKDQQRPFSRSDSESQQEPEVIQQRERELQEDLRQTKERLEFALLAADAGTWEWDLRTNINTWSDQLWKLYGLESHSCQPSYEIWKNTIHPDDREVTEQIVAKVVAQGAEVNLEYRVVYPDGSHHWIMSRGRPVLDSEGHVLRYSGIVIDITERKQIEEVQLFLAQSVFYEPDGNFFQKLARYLAEKLGMEFVCIDRLEGEGLEARTEAMFHDGKFLDNVSYTLKGTPCGEVVGKQVCSFPRGVCRLFPQDLVLQDLKAESYAGVTLWGQDGKPIGLIAVIGRHPQNDLHRAESILKLVAARAAGELERRRAEEVLRMSETRVRKKLDALLQPEGDIGQLELADVIDCDAIQSLMIDFFRLTGIGIGIVDLHGNVLVKTGWQDVCTQFHRQHPETLKFCRESDLELSQGVARGAFKQYRCKNNMWDTVTPIMIAGKHLGNLFLGQFFYDDEQIDREVFCKQAHLYGFDEKEYLAAIDRAPRWSRDKVDAVMSFYSRFAELVGSLSFSTVKLARALSEREKLHSQLVQAQKMESIGRLAGGVAHDFNNMLGVILGNAEFALSQVDPGNPVHAELREIERAAKRSANFTRQLLAFARKQTILPKTLDLNEMVGAMLGILRRSIGEHIDLVWNPDKTITLIDIDPTQIDQILVNLVINARDAIGGHGAIILATRKRDIDLAQAQRFDVTAGEFVVLSVADNGCGMDKSTLESVFEPFFTTKTREGGTGLGLATVYGIVKQNHGFIDVSSEPGKGTTFDIGFPRSHGDITQPLTKSSAEIPHGNGETILLVEDESMLLDVGRIMLKKLGYKVLPAASPTEALRLANEHPGKIDLLVTDVIMPEMNGSQLAKRIRQQIPTLECLFMSGHTYDLITHQGLLDEGVFFLQKPFLVEDLAVRVARALKKA